jgi:hypothetical protein
MVSVIQYDHSFNRCSAVIVQDIEYLISLFQGRIYNYEDATCLRIMAALLKFVVEHDLNDLQEPAENVFQTWFGDPNLI